MGTVEVTCTPEKVSGWHAAYMEIVLRHPSGGQVNSAGVFSVRRAADVIGRKVRESQHAGNEVTCKIMPARVSPKIVQALRWQGIEVVDGDDQMER